MTPLEAKRILALYRPESGDAGDPDFAEALVMVGQDPELGRWFERHSAFQSLVRDRFRHIAVPEGLKDRILADRKILRPSHGWRHPGVLALAAALTLLAALSWVWLKPAAEGSFGNFRSRMVQNALRQYGMDIVTNQMSSVRQFIARQGAPADYVLPKILESLSLTGGGVLRWRNQPVSMVCFDRGDHEMLFLFVIAQEVVPGAPPESPLLAKVNRLLTASWSADGHTYVLAGPEEPGFLEKYLGLHP